MNKTHRFFRVGGVLVGFLAVFVAVHLLQSPVHEAIGQFVDLRSEYRAYEQLSKYYLFLIILVATAAYSRSASVSRLRTSLAFLLLGTVLYLAESNMITEKVQLLFGPVVLGATLLLLYRECAWLPVFFLCAGTVVMFGGVMSDFASERKAIAALIPAGVMAVIDNEEIFDVMGQGLICLAAIFYFLDEVAVITRRDKLAVLVLLLASGFVTAGNSFSHYQYRPGDKLEGLALLLSLGGLIGIVIANRRMRRRKMELALPTERGFYLFVWVLFMMLPTMFGGTDDLASVVLWSPTLIVFVAYLYAHHSLRPEVPILPSRGEVSCSP